MLDFLKFDIQRLGYVGGCVDEECRFIAFAAMGNWREVWRIGFEQNSVDADCGKYFAKSRVLESDDAVDAEVMVTIAANTCHIVGVAPETVEYALWNVAFSAFENIENRVEPFSAMNDDRKVGIESPSELSIERFRLLFCERFVPI